MRLYERWILPWLIDLAMRNRALARYRDRTLAAASGSVLEIGIGPGLNLPRYPAGVSRICALDPSAALLRLAAARRDAAPCPVALVRGVGEQLPFRRGLFRHRRDDLDAVLDPRSARCTASRCAAC